LLRKFIEEDHIDVNVLDKDGNTPLHWTTSHNLAEPTKYLLEHGAAIDRWILRSFFVLFFLRHHANIELADVKGRTPMHWAAHMGEIACAQVLRENGATLDRVDCDGKTPYDLAAVKKFMRITQFLSKEVRPSYKGKYDVLWRSIAVGMLPGITLLYCNLSPIIATIIIGLAIAGVFYGLQKCLPGAHEFNPFGTGVLGSLYILS